MKGPNMIIDAHGHASGEYVTLEKILEKLNTNHIEKVILFPGEIGNDKVDHIPDTNVSFVQQARKLAKTLKN
jgi:hypothetical protein